MNTVNTEFSYAEVWFTNQFLFILKMHEIDKAKLTDQTKFKLYEIKKIENYFIN